MDPDKQTIKVGSRKSQLALIQTNAVISKLKTIYKEKNLKLSISTTGDRILDVPLSQIGQKSLFTKELEVALAAKVVDFVVHSLKDLPTILPDGMVIAAVCKRDNPHDAVVLHPKHQDKSLNTLSPGSVVGTSSLRRIAQIRRKYPSLVCKDVRGNLNTRLRKLDDDESYDALVLAAAGLERMGWKDRISEYLAENDILYAVGQGALAVECRADDHDTVKMLSSLHDTPTLLCCIAERAFLKQLEGGCSVPIGVYSKYENSLMYLNGIVLSLDGSECFTNKIETELNDSVQPPAKKQKSTSDHENHHTYTAIIAPLLDQEMLAKAEETGISLAKLMQDAGANKLLEEVRKECEKRQQST